MLVKEHKHTTLFHPIQWLLALCDVVNVTQEMNNTQNISRERMLWQSAFFNVKVSLTIRQRRDLEWRVTDI